jgi:hypothetical protein
MPNSPFVDMPQEKPAELLATLRRARYGSLLARHILWPEFAVARYTDQQIQLNQ